MKEKQQHLHKQKWRTLREREQEEIALHTNNLKVSIQQYSTIMNIPFLRGQGQ